MILGIVELYCGSSGKKGYYNSQEVGLARAMKLLGYEIFIFYPRVDMQQVQEEVVEECITIVYVPAKCIGVHGKYQWDILNHYGVQIVQIGSDNQLFAPSLVRYCEKHKLLLYHYIGTVSTDGTGILKKLIFRVASGALWAMRKKHKCFAKTMSVKKQLEDAGIENVDIAPVGLDTTVIPTNLETRKYYREKLGISESVCVILFVGRIDTYKRPFEAIKLLSALEDRQEGQYQLIAIGSGALDREFAEEIEQSGHGNCIQWIKRLPNEKVHAYYLASDYFVNFNEKEIFGMSILEAMYHGCMVIANHAPGPDSIIENEKSGYLVHSLEEMEQIISQRKKLDESAVTDRIRSNFLWSNTANILNDWILSNLNL